MKQIGKTGIGMVLSLSLVGGTAGIAAAQVGEAEGMADPPSITIDLEATGTQGVGGEAVLSPAGEQTSVALDVSGAPAETVLTGFVISGVCADDGDVIAELGAIEVDAAGAGRLTAELPIDLATIAAAPVAVQVRPAGEEASPAIACGQHFAVADTDPTPPAAETPSDPMPLPDPAPEADQAPLPDPSPDPMPEPTDDPFGEPTPDPMPGM